MNKSINNIRTMTSSKEKNKLCGYLNINNNNVHVTSLKCSSKHINLFAAGDSQLNLKIFDIETKKQIISYKCLVNKGYNLNTNKILIITLKIK